MVRERTADILEAAVREFIRTGEPTSSSELFHRYQFGIKPAMIRHELHALTDRGYLVQSYHSAGRIPSDRGFEFFAERILERECAAPPSIRAFEEMFRRARWDTLLEAFSREFGVLCVVDDEGSGEVYKEGLDDLIEHLSWETPNEVNEVVRDFEAIDERLDILDPLLEGDGIKIFVGKRSPITKSKNLAVIARDVAHDGGRVVLVAVGPKRMDYEEVVTVFRGLE